MTINLMKWKAFIILFLLTTMCHAQEEEVRPEAKYIHVTTAGYLAGLPRDAVYRGYSLGIMNGLLVHKSISVGFTTGLTMLSRNAYGERNWFSISWQAHLGYYPPGKMKLCLDTNIGGHSTLPCSDVPLNAYGRVTSGGACVSFNGGVKARIGNSASFVMMMGYLAHGYLRKGYEYNTRRNGYYLGFVQVRCGVELM